MKKTFLVAFTFCLAGCSRSEPVVTRDASYDEIRTHLTEHIELLQRETIKEVVTPAEVWRQADKEWTEVMKNFRAKISGEILTGRESLVRRKEQVYEGWKRQCRILLDQLNQRGAELHRYDEGLGGSAGYAVLVDGKPKYWLHFRFNRTRDNY